MHLLICMSVQFDHCTNTIPSKPRHEKNSLRGLQTDKTQTGLRSHRGLRLEILDIETRDITLSTQRLTKALIRLRGCAG